MNNQRWEISNEGRKIILFLLIFEGFRKRKKSYIFFFLNFLFL
jgi:hypothetical protein